MTTTNNLDATEDALRRREAMLKQHADRNTATITEQHNRAQSVAQRMDSLSAELEKVLPKTLQLLAEMNELGSVRPTLTTALTRVPELTTVFCFTLAAAARDAAQQRGLLNGWDQFGI